MKQVKNLLKRLGERVEEEHRKQQKVRQEKKLNTVTLHKQLGAVMER